MTQARFVTLWDKFSAAVAASNQYRSLESHCEEKESKSGKADLSVELSPGAPENKTGRTPDVRTQNQDRCPGLESLGV